MTRTKANITDLEDRTLSNGQQIITDGSGGYVLGAAGGGHATGTIVIYDEGDFIGVFDAMDFIGAGVAAYDSGTYAAIAITGTAAAPGGGGSGTYPIAYVTGNYNGTTRGFTTNVTWLYCGNTSGTFHVERPTLVSIVSTLKWGGTNNNWEYLYWRVTIDGTGLDFDWKTRQQNRQNNETFVHTSEWMTFVASGTHTFTLETYTPSGFQWNVYQTAITVIAYEGGTAWVPLV